MAEEVLTVQSTVLRLQEFLEGTVWHDIQAELNVWEESQRNELLTVSDLYTLGKIQGRIEFIGSMRQLPSVILEGLKEITDVIKSHQSDTNETELDAEEEL